MASFNSQKEVFNRKCKAPGDIAGSQVHRLAMFITDKIALSVCINIAILSCYTFWQSILELDTQFY
jgi:hypothetical protein